MKFQPKSADDIKRESLIPTGEYDFEVVKATEGTSKKGNPMITVDLHVWVDGNTRKQRDWLMEAMAYKLRHFCESIGMLDEYNNGTLDPIQLSGKTGKVSIVIKDSEEYGPQNSVKDYVVTEKKTEDPHYPPKPQRPSHVAAGGSDEPPFHRPLIAEVWG